MNKHRKPIKITNLKEDKARRDTYDLILHAWNYWQDNVRDWNTHDEDHYFGVWIYDTWGVKFDESGPYWNTAKFTDPQKKLLFLLRFS